MSTPHPNNAIALLCTLHSSSPTARTRILFLLSSARSYYADPKSQCTTWSYYTPSSNPKAPSQIVPKHQRDTVAIGVEIYSAKEALTSQQSEPWFKEFAGTVEREGLYDREKGEELVAWYPTAGFVARGDGGGGVAAPFGKGVIGMLAVFMCKEGKRDEVVAVIGKYTNEHVLPNEPGVLTYCILTRPKAPNEILLFERYKDPASLGAHGSTKEFKAMFKGIAPNIEVKQTRLQQLSELDGSFVGNIIGNQVESARSKL